MAEKKANEVDGWLRRPDAATTVVLVFGPDRGLVSERARAFAQSTGLALDDPFAVVKLDGAGLEREPGRLTEEAAAVPMFTDRRLIWARGIGAGTALAQEVAALAAGGSRDTIILLEAGDLKKGTGLRGAVEKSANAVGLPCYADEARSIDAVIDETLARENLSIDPEARQALRGLLGGDRLATRGELEKLALYCRGSGRIGLADVEAAIGDVAARSQEDLLDAVMTGDAAGADRILASLQASGGLAGGVLPAATRRFQTLEMLKAEMGGRPAQAVVASARPPIFFARRRAYESALSQWSQPALASALSRLEAATLQSRERGRLAEAIVRQALLALALEARRGRRERA